MARALRPSDKNDCDVGVIDDGARYCESSPRQGFASSGEKVAVRHYRVTLADALSAHDFALRYGGLPGILNLNMVQAAISRPYNGYFRPIARKAAALLDGVARFHGFADGNKRSAVLLTEPMLSQSMYVLRASDRELEEATVAVATGQMKFEELVEWFSVRVRRIA